MKQNVVPLNRKKELKSWLEEEILEGRLRPGDQIDEQAVASRFGVSRTPVREALLQLATLDLIEFRPRNGALVRQMSVREIAAMWEVLVELESLAASLSARRMQAQDREALAAIYEESVPLVRDGHVGAYDEANRRFHEIVYSGCCNAFLAGQAMTIRSRLKPYRRYPFQRAGGLQRSLEGHRKVLEAITQGDDEAAARAMREHVAGGLSFLDLVAELQPPGTAAQAGVAPSARDKRTRRRANKR